MKLLRLLPAFVVSGVLGAIAVSCVTKRPDDTQDEKKQDDKPAGRKAEPAPQPVAKTPAAEEPTPAPTTSGEPFRLPDDLAGRLVGKIVAPPERLGDEGQRRVRKGRAAGRVENPTVPLPPQVASLPRFDEGKRRPLLPLVVTPEPVYGLVESMAEFPQALTLPAIDRIRLTSPDVAVPVPLPRMAEPVAEKSTATDPTADASKAAVLAAPLPGRIAPVPFEKVTVPDPFENQETVKLTLPAEMTTPEGGVAVPKR